MKKHAIVTGGARGIGLAISAHLFKDGYNVSVIGRAEKSKAENALFSTGISPQNFFYFSGDISAPDDREAFIKKAVEKFGTIDILVNNAGVAPAERRDLLEMTPESFDRVISINVKGNLGMSQLVAKNMLSRPYEGKRRGIIINISSCSAYATSVNRGEYCISKAGVSMLTQLFADRLADEGINVFEVRPGIIATDMTSAVKEKYDRLIAEGLLPIKRWGTPEDVAGAVSILCDERLGYCTGDIINADGGFHIQRL